MRYLFEFRFANGRRLGPIAWHWDPPTPLDEGTTVSGLDCEGVEAWTVAQKKNVPGYARKIIFEELEG
jgi:hypothetical protein